MLVDPFGPEAVDIGVDQPEHGISWCDRGIADDPAHPDVCGAVRSFDLPEGGVVRAHHEVGDGAAGARELEDVERAANQAPAGEWPGGDGARSGLAGTAHEVVPPDQALGAGGVEVGIGPVPVGHADTGVDGLQIALEAQDVLAVPGEEGRAAVPVSHRALMLADVGVVVAVGAQLIDRVGERLPFGNRETREILPAAHVSALPCRRAVWQARGAPARARDRGRDREVARGWGRGEVPS